MKVKYNIIRNKNKYYLVKESELNNFVIWKEKDVKIKNFYFQTDYIFKNNINYFILSKIEDNIFYIKNFSFFLKNYKNNVYYLFLEVKDSYILYFLEILKLIVSKRKNKEKVFDLLDEFVKTFYYEGFIENVFYIFDWRKIFFVDDLKDNLVKKINKYNKIWYLKFIFDVEFDFYQYKQIEQNKYIIKDNSFYETLSKKIEPKKNKVLYIIKNFEYYFTKNKKIYEIFLYLFKKKYWQYIYDKNINWDDYKRWKEHQIFKIVDVYNIIKVKKEKHKILYKPIEILLTNWKDKVLEYLKKEWLLWKQWKEEYIYIIYNILKENNIKNYKDLFKYNNKKVKKTIETFIFW